MSEYVFPSILYFVYSFKLRIKKIFLNEFEFNE